MTAVVVDFAARRAKPKTVDTTRIGAGLTATLASEAGIPVLVLSRADGEPFRIPLGAADDAYRLVQIVLKGSALLRAVDAL